MLASSRPRRVAAELAASLASSVPKEVAFLRVVDAYADTLYDADVLKLAVARYTLLWLPLCKEATKATPACCLRPPLDIAFVWHCHVLNPTRYFSDCEQLLSVVPQHKVLDVLGGQDWLASDETRDLWATKYPGAPCDIAALADPAAAAAAMRSSLSAVHGDWEARAAAAAAGMYDIGAAASRQAVFHYQVSLPHYSQSYFHMRCVTRYLTFLRLQSENPKVKLCPTYGIDIVWHAHMANDPHGYKRHTEALLGEHFAHDDSINDRAADAPLVALQAQTEALFAGAGLRFSEPGGMFRGTPPLLTASQRAQATGGAIQSGVVVTAEVQAPEGGPATPLGGTKSGDTSTLASGSLATVSSVSSVGEPLSPEDLQRATCMVTLKTIKLLQRSRTAHSLVRDGPARLLLSKASHLGRPLRVAVTKASVMSKPFSTMVGGGAAALKEGSSWPLHLASRGLFAAKGELRATLAAAADYSTVAVALDSPHPTASWPAMWEPCRAADVLTSPELLLPLAALQGSEDHADHALLSAAIADPLQRSQGNTTLQVHIVNSLRYSSTVIETIRNPGADKPTPAATARTISSDQLPVPSEMALANLTPCLHVPFARAMLIRTANEDWAVLRGSWCGKSRQKPVPGVNGTASQPAVPGIPFRPGRLRLQLFKLPSRDDVRSLGVRGAQVLVSEGAESRTVVRWSQAASEGAGRYEFKVDCAPYNTLTIDLQRGRACFETAISTGAYNTDATLVPTLQALCPTLVAAAAALHALCMPGVPGGPKPSHPLGVMNHLYDNMRDRKYVAAERWAASAAVMGSSCVATNAHLASEKLQRDASTEALPPAVTCPAATGSAWDGASVMRCGAASAGGLGCTSIAADGCDGCGGCGGCGGGGGGGGGMVVLARFKVNKHDVVSVFKATTKEDFKDVVKLLPENTPLPASNKMTYLIARLELTPSASIDERIAAVNAGRATMGDSVGPAVGCLMATFGTFKTISCIFDIDDPEEIEEFAVEERIELWGLQIPHNSMRPVLKDADPEALAAEAEAAEEQTVAWSSVDRLNMSVGLLYALCVNANASNVRCVFCVLRSQLLRRWQGAGVRMKEVTTKMRLIYPPHAHDFEYYKSSTVAYFLVDDVADGLTTKLALMDD